MGDEKTAKSLRFRSKLEFDNALRTLRLSRKKERRSVQNLFMQVCGPCQDGSEPVDATVYCRTCHQYMCAECKQADEKLHRGKNKHIIVSLEEYTENKERKLDETSDDTKAKDEHDNHEQVYSGMLAHATTSVDGEDETENHAVCGNQSAATENEYVKNTLEQGIININIDHDVHHGDQISKTDSDYAERKGQTVFKNESDYASGTTFEKQNFDAVGGQKRSQTLVESAKSSSHITMENKETNGGMEATESEEAEFITLRQRVDIRYHELETGCDISDVSCLPNRDIIIADTMNERLKMFTKLDKHKDYKFDSWPWNMALKLSPLDDVCVYVTLPDLRQIVLIHIGTHLQKTDTIETSGDCWGIVSTKEKLIVSIWNENNNGFIQVLSFEGILLQTLGNETKMRKFLACPSFLATNEAGNKLYATDAENQAIHIMQIEDNKLRREPLFVDKNVERLCGVVAGTDNDMYVADISKMCIYHVKKGNDRKYQSKSLISATDGLDFYPRCVYFDSRKKCIIVCGFSENILVFK